MNAEVKWYLERLVDRRHRFQETLRELPIGALDWRPLARGTNSIFALAAHALGAERFWLHRMVGQRPIERDREAEFRAQAIDLAALRISYDLTAPETERILFALTESEMEAQRTSERGTYTVRWCILHVLEHYSEHWGQVELTRQLWEENHPQAQQP